MKHLQMKYFVLSPSSSDEKHAEASRAAMRAFAKSISNTEPEWAKDILEWVDSIAPEPEAPPVDVLV